MNKTGGTESMFRILSCATHFSSPIATQLGARYASRNLLDHRGTPVHSGCDDHRVPMLLLDDITAILRNRQGRKRSSRYNRLSNDAAWHVSPGNNATPRHLHRWVHGTVSSGVTWPFTIPGKLDHGITPCVWATTPLDGNTRKVGHNDQEDRDWRNQMYV